MVTVTDTLVSTQAYTLEVLAGVQSEQVVMQEGMDKQGRALDMLHEEHDSIRKAVDAQEVNQEAQSRETERAMGKARATQNSIHRLQLERSQSVIVVHNIAPLTSAARETYHDLEALVTKLFKELHVSREGIRFNAVRRLQRSKMDTSGDYPALRIELGGVGDKLKIYQAIDHLVKSGKKVSFQINNEIPEYAIKAYKTQCRIATYIRKMNVNTKTRVSIERGDLWPTITTKQRGQGGKYQKVLQQVYEQAKDEVTRERKQESERRKKAREDQLLRDDDMDTAG